MTMAQDPYGESVMDPNCSGANKARQQRYIERLTTEGATSNLNYSANGPVADGTQYANVCDQILVVEPGQDISLTLKCADKDDGLKWCLLAGWLDYNNNKFFEEDEQIISAGNVRAATPEFQSEDGATFTFNVPLSATFGNSRLRLVFTDAWFDAPQPTGYHNKGFTIDFGVDIVEYLPEGTIKANDIYYRITSEYDNTVEVTYRGEYSDSYHNEYSGTVTSPESVRYIGNDAFDYMYNNGIGLEIIFNYRGNWYQHDNLYENLASSYYIYGTKNNIVVVYYVNNQKVTGGNPGIKDYTYSEAICH